ncbi:hypothetical protein GN244_ATG20895 [Phytophthora infestans]|uniref:Ubiquitin-like protease family profile domain-containing protein n=1 Tax=Phytophthora infestans TaxID=4787 RepID=A0A833S198_PHYIN|nr:hypothetical protein GN244_ATG20895 [Phytophthora infestans]
MYAWTAIPNQLSQRKRPRDSDQEVANVLPDTRPVIVVRNRTRADSCGEGSSVAELVSIYRVPRQRRSKTWGQRIGIIKSVEHVSNLLPPFPLRESNDWDSILEAAISYTEDNHFRYRWRYTETHNNHEVKSDIVSSYLGPAYADDHPEVLNTLAEMVHARAESRCITFFLTDKLGRPVTSQQARNIMHRLEGKADAQEKQKLLMNVVAQEKGSDRGDSESAFARMLHRFLSSNKKKWLSEPKQPDGSSCGVLIIAQAYALLSNQTGLSKVTREQVRVL